MNHPASQVDPRARLKATLCAYLAAILVLLLTTSARIVNLDQPGVSSYAAWPESSSRDSLLAATAGSSAAGALNVASAVATSKNPSSSSPIAVTSDDSAVVVVNPLNNSISILNVASDANQKAAEVKVGTDPRTVVISPDDKFAYVTNQGEKTVSVIDL